ncbi:hypothetical protein HU200_060785 [Digitaria exilis]|uniref:NAC domain-containing protein n=1 Tax=Digitaria exilis TaxID=1010633 RepID=A0A835A5Z4_9POAL|nr:hypothetical protein HU200_060785 [Digitaria exilis]
MDEIPPAYRFRPTQRELVEFYLLPRSRGQDPFPGVIIEDDTAGSSLPWDLFERHGLGTEDEAYFFVRASDATKKRGARQDRGCDGGVGSWKMQNSREKGLRVGGEKIGCRKSNLNLHMGKGKNGGSVGWVMHEYTIATPPCPSPVKICHIAFTGHGRKRERVPGGQEDCQTGQALPQVDATAAGGGCSGGMPDDRDSGALVHASADEQGSQPVLTKDNIFSQNPVLGASEFMGFPSAASANAEQYQYQELEQEVPSNLWSSTWLESNNVVPHISDNVVQQLDRVQEDNQTGQASASQIDATAAGGCSEAMLDCDSDTVVNVSADEERSQPVLTEDIFSLSPLLDSSDFLGSPSASSANAEQYQELEQVVPSTEEEQAMVPQLIVEQSVSSLEEQQYAGDLEFWSSDLESSNLGGNLWSPTGSNDFAEQGFWSSTMVESDGVVPHTGDMEEGHQDQQDFRSLSGAQVQNNCAMPDIAAGAVAAANCHLGGYCITC